MLRDEPNTYGFITKKYPSNNHDAFFVPKAYKHIYAKEISKLIEVIKSNPDKVYLISKLGAGLANKYKIFERVLNPCIKEDLKEFDNVQFLW